MLNLVGLRLRGSHEAFDVLMSCHVASKSEDLTSNRIRTGYVTAFTATTVVFPLLSLWLRKSYLGLF